jgi:hypothetical protein
MESWKIIKGFDNYAVSTFGRVRNIKTGKILSPFTTKNGYQMVNPSRGGISCKLYVHRLVAEAFIPIVDTNLQVNHINGNKSDNRLDNLEWCTSSENHLHRSRILGIKRSADHMSMMCDLAAKAHYRSVKCVETDVIYKSCVEASKAINRSPTSIWQALSGRTDTCGGFHWEYV